MEQIRITLDREQCQRRQLLYDEKISQITIEIQSEFSSSRENYGLGAASRTNHILHGSRMLRMTDILGTMDGRRQEKRGVIVESRRCRRWH